MTSRINTISDSNYLEPRTVCSISSRLNLQNWVNTGGIGGQIGAPNSLSPPPLPPKHYINGDVVSSQNCNSIGHHYMNVNLSDCPDEPNNDINNSYINVDLDQIQCDSVKSPKTSTSSNNYIQLDNVKPEDSSNVDESPNLDLNRVYMNVVPGNLSPTCGTVSEETVNFSSNRVQHNYINLESNMVKNQILSSSAKFPYNDHQSTGFHTKSASFTGQMNYIVLDLDNNQNSDPNPSPSSLHSNHHLFESNKPSEGYATIDFDRTEALSHTVVPNVDNDKEGCRKTRHHSTVAVSDTHLLAFPTRGSSSLSD